MATVTNMSNLKTLFPEQEIQQRIEEVADQIAYDFGGKPKGSRDLGKSLSKPPQDMVAVVVLKGAAPFSVDLLKALNDRELDPSIEYIRLSSYNGGTQSSGKVKTMDLTLPDLTNKDVLIIEDIVDTGRTADFLFTLFKNQTKARSVAMVSLLDKECKREPEHKNIKPDYCCFNIEDNFVVGYGLDLDEKYRTLRYIGHFED